MLFNSASSENKLPNFYWGREGRVAWRWYEAQLHILSQSCFQFYMYLHPQKKLTELILKLSEFCGMTQHDFCWHQPTYSHPEVLPLRIGFSSLWFAKSITWKYIYNSVHTHTQLFIHLLSIWQTRFNSLSASLLYFWHSFLIPLLLFSKWEEGAKINVLMFNWKSYMLIL